MTLTQRITWAIVELETETSPDRKQIIDVLEDALAQAITQEFNQRLTRNALIRTAKVIGA